MIDGRLLPMAFVFIIVIILLFIALYNSFLCREKVSESYIKERLSVIEDNGRVNHIYIESIDEKIGNIKLLNYKKIIDDIKQDMEIQNSNENSSVVYIDGPVDLSDKLNNGSLIQLNNDDIYTVYMPNPNRAGQTMNIWNSSGSAKNLKASAKFIINGVEKSYIFTLKPENIITVQSNGIFWVILTSCDFSDNKDMMLKYLLNKVELAIESSRVELDLRLENTHSNLICQLKDDKELYKDEIHKIMCAFEHDMKIKISDVNIDKLQNSICEKIKCKVDSDHKLVKRDILEIIRDESNKLNCKLSNMKDQVSQEIAYAIATDAADLKQRLSKHIEINSNIAKEEAYAKITVAMKSQQSDIMERVEHQINSVVSTKVQTAMIDMKESILLIIQSKIKDDPINIKAKIDNINQNIASIESYFKATIDSEILELQQKMQGIIIDMKANLTSMIDSKISIVNSQISSIKSELTSLIDNSKIQIKSQISISVSNLKNEIYSELENIKDSFNSKLLTVKENITNIVDDTHEYIDDQIVEIKSVITNQINIIENEIQLQRSYIDSKIASGDKTLTSLQAKIITLQGEVVNMKTNINTGTISVNNLLASTITLSNTLNNLYINTISSSVLQTDNSQNMFVGTDYEMNKNPIYIGNTGVGVNTLSYATMNIGNNTAIGANSFRSSIGDYNTCIGGNITNMVSSYGSYIGYGAGKQSTGNYNTLLGALTKCSSYNYSTAIGVNATVTSDNQIMLGGDNGGIYPTIITPGPISAEGGIKFQGNGGYILSINSSNQYSYIPLVMSTPSIDVKDYYVILNPGFKIVVFTRTNYDGSSYTFDNTNGYQIINISSTVLYGSNSEIVSYKLYYNSKLVDSLI